MSVAVPEGVLLAVADAVFVADGVGVFGLTVGVSVGEASPEVFEGVGLIV